MIGDCRTAALVGRDGSIDWFCLPRFDGEACFAALLGKPEHGRWKIAPKAPAKVTRHYRDGSLVLDTRFETRSGIVSVVDFMPIGRPESSIVRRVIGRAGRVAVHAELVLRFDYGITVPWVSRGPRGVLTAIAGPHLLALAGTVPMRGKDLRSVADFTIAAGQTHSFVLTHGPSHLPVPRPFNAKAALAATEKFWRGWSGSCDDVGEWSAAVRRSLITLKGLSFEATGGIVAAPTTSLPELMGGERNWDYRYCWLRDAAFTLLAFLNAGYREEAHAWRDWLLRAVAGSPDQMQIMYGLGGERRLDEWQVPWLPGFAASAPVRIGNAAAGQLQLDVYGEVADALALARKGGLSAVRRGVNSHLLAGASGAHLASARQRHLGGARQAAAFHPFQGDDLGRLPARRRFAAISTRRRAGGGEGWRTASTARSAAMRSIPGAGISSRPMARGAWTPACCCWPSSASCRPMIRASARRWPPSSAGSWSMGWSCAMRPTETWTGCPRGRVPSSPAASGSPTIMP